VTQIPPNWQRLANPAGRRLLRNGDVIVAVDGKKEEMSEIEFLAYLAQNTAPGESTALLVLRDGKQRILDFPIP